MEIIWSNITFFVWCYRRQLAYLIQFEIIVKKSKFTSIWEVDVFAYLRMHARIQ